MACLAAPMKSHFYFYLNFFFFLQNYWGGDRRPCRPFADAPVIKIKMRIFITGILFL
jgi:hypothetical protein